MSSDYRWTAAANDDGIKLAGNTQAGQRRIGDQRQAFTREIVDDRQDAKPPAIGERIRQKIQAPALVWALRECHRGPRPDGSFAPRSPADLKPFFTVEAPELLMVHDDALAPEQDVKPAITKPSANGRKFT